MLKIRAETPGDHERVTEVNESAFGQTDEAALVSVLRRNAKPYISLVAEFDGIIVGHIFFSPVSFSPTSAAAGASELSAVGLAPMAVAPEFQRQGIGSELIRHGLEECRRRGHDLVVVVGHPEYYPRFGFETASTKRVQCEFTVPDEAFMVAELKPGVLAGRAGVVRYHEAFHAIEET
jgi:putative acetyltransferase